VSFTEFFGVVKDLVLIGTGITGAVVAVRGLKTWQRQLHGQADYTLARDILINLFKYRDALNEVRNPAMFSNEMPLPPEDKKKGMSDKKIRHYGLVEAYRTRLKKVSIQRAAMYTSTIESQALWGGDLTKLINALYKHENLLTINIRYNLILNDPDLEDRAKEFAHKNFKMEVIYDDYSDDDEFRKEFSLSLEPVEFYLKSKLAKDFPENKFFLKIKSIIIVLKTKLSCFRPT